MAGSSITTVNNQVISRINPSLESVLGQLSEYGKPHVTLSRRGWWSGVELYVAARGSSFTVRCDGGHATALEAALECLDRVLAVRHTPLVEASVGAKPVTTVLVTEAAK